MACRKGELREEGSNRHAAAVPSSTVGDAFLFTTMCIIGMPVDVHGKDGSVYTGIFHTASVDEDYAIVLKKARMVRKGNLEGNVRSGTLIETLIVQSEDLVQVVAKGVLLSGNAITVHGGTDCTVAAVGYNECPDSDTEVVKPCEAKGNKKKKSQTRQIGDASLQIQSDNPSNAEFQNKRITEEVQGSSPSVTSCEAKSNDVVNILEKSMLQEPKGVSSGCPQTIGDQCQERITSDETSCAIDSLSNVSVASAPIIDTKLESCLSESSNPSVLVPPTSSSLKRATEVSKLNPGAKIFSPSMLHHRAMTPAVPNGAKISYMPATYIMGPMAAAQEVNTSSFIHTSVPVKLVPYDNTAVHHCSSDVPYVQPGAAGLSPATTRPIFTSHQMHLAKYQGRFFTGNDPAQTLQLYMRPQIVGSGPLPIVLTSSIPNSQPLFPVLRPAAVLRSNGLMSS